MSDTIEVRVELTQKEADAVACALRTCGVQRGWFWHKSELALLERVARKFQNATRDAECREAEDAHIDWVNREMCDEEVTPDPDVVVRFIKGRSSVVRR